MYATIPAQPNCQATVAVDNVCGPLEWWRASLGHGGINSVPLPERVVEGITKLRPRLIRTFIQEFFHIYPNHDQFDWSLLDPYMSALARTGARVVAAITIKPQVLFPQVDQVNWRPTDMAEWQRVIYQLVKRYSVDRPIVAYWEVGNETDIGESGGCPYLIRDPQNYFDYYCMTTQPILAAHPQAKVGGPASCWVENEPLPGLVQKCRATGTRLDFISWHCYNDDPQRHARGVARAKEMLADFPGTRPEMLVTEWSKGFEKVSVEDQAFNPKRAAIVGAGLLDMLDAGLDWSFYYHIWDQVCYAADFAPFFSPQGVKGMVEHWNEIPHRFGLFGVSQEVRPQYFVYQLLSRLGEQRVAACTDSADLRILAARSTRRVATLLVNHNPNGSCDRVVDIRFTNLSAGRKTLTTYRIDAGRRWSEENLELLPLEHREIDTPTNYHCHVYCPADTVAAVILKDIGSDI